MSFSVVFTKHNVLDFNITFSHILTLITIILLRHFSSHRITIRYSGFPFGLVPDPAKSVSTIILNHTLSSRQIPEYSKSRLSQ
jgi:hypothetical protein